MLFMSMPEPPRRWISGSTPCVLGVGCSSRLRLMVPGGKLGLGYMLLVTRAAEERFDARFVCPAMFIPCVGGRDKDTVKKLAEAFRSGRVGKVRSLRRRTAPDETCWCSGNGWWLSTAEDIKELACDKSS